MESFHIPINAFVINFFSVVMPLFKIICNQKYTFKITDQFLLIIYLLQIDLMTDSSVQTFTRNPHGVASHRQQPPGIHRYQDGIRFILVTDK